jgi:hypothetical protein
MHCCEEVGVAGEVDPGGSDPDDVPDGLSDDPRVRASPAPVLGVDDLDGDTGSDLELVTRPHRLHRAGCDGGHERLGPCRHDEEGQVTEALHRPQVKVIHVDV